MIELPKQLSEVTCVTGKAIQPPKDREGDALGDDIEGVRKSC